MQQSYLYISKGLTRVPSVPQTSCTRWLCRHCQFKPEILVGKVEEQRTDSPHPHLGVAGATSSTAKPIVSDLQEFIQLQMFLGLLLGRAAEQIAQPFRIQTGMVTRCWWEVKYWATLEGRLAASYKTQHKSSLRPILNVNPKKRKPVSTERRTHQCSQHPY